MTLTQLNSLQRERKRLAEAFKSLLQSRNMIIDNFQTEYERHVKLTAKKENPREALLLSLSKSRNMKRLQKEFLDMKKRIIENQRESKLLKKTWQAARQSYIKDIRTEALYNRGESVFGTNENFEDWMNKTSVSLGNNKPIDLIETEGGIQVVIDELGRIEHGIFA